MRTKDFWSSLSSSGKKESYQNNPDLIAEVCCVMPEELIAILEVLDEGGERILTPKQRRAFQLVIRENYTERAAAIKMKCDESTVREHVTAAAKKLRSLCQTKLGE
jgi:predicted DNA-binding protein (UPF0251 family)